jgi:hypothetical protein
VGIFATPREQRRKILRVVGGHHHLAIDATDGDAVVLPVLLDGDFLATTGDDVEGERVHGLILLGVQHYMGFQGIAVRRVMFPLA